MTRSGIKNLLEEGMVLVNDKASKSGHKIKPDDRISIEIPEPEPLTIKPEPIPIDIVYEDDDIIVVNKPAGIAVHPGAGQSSGTLINALAYHTKDKLSKIGDPMRPGVVHRLDKDTTGALIFAKTDEAYRNLSEQFKAHSTGRKYIALVWGDLKEDEGSVDLAIGRDLTQRKKFSPRTKKSRTAITHYKVMKRYLMMSLVELTLETGRTHQIRVHLTAIHHPVVGDQIYGKRKVTENLPKPIFDVLKRMKRQCLHAKTLNIKHPRTGERMEFSAPLPPDMDEVLKQLDEHARS